MLRGRVSEQMRTGAVLVLRDEQDIQHAQRTTTQPSNWAETRQRLLVKSVWAVISISVLVSCSWGVTALLSVAPTMTTSAVWMTLSMAIVAVIALIVLVASKNPWFHGSLPGELAKPMGGGWVVLLAILVGLISGSSLAYALALEPTTGLVLAAWCACAIAVVIWAWRRDTQTKLGAQFLFVLALIATGMILLPNGVQMLAPIVAALAAAALIAVPVMAPQAPPEQSVDIPLLATSALSQRSVQTHAPNRVSTPRAISMVQDAKTTWTVVAVVSGIAAVTFAWPIITMTGTGGLQGWASLGLLVAVLTVLALAPVTSPLRPVRLAPRLAAVVTVAEWSVWAAISGVVQPWSLALGLVTLGLLAMAISLASTREEGAPLLGRLGDIVLGLAQLGMFPAALLSSGLFHYLWTAPHLLGGGTP